MKIVYIQPPTTAKEQPLLYIKPDTAVHNRELPLYIPDFTADLRAQAVLLVKLSRQGKCISPQFAPKYYEQISLGLALTAYDRLQMLQGQGLPWELATSFDSSMVVGQFVSVDTLGKEAMATFAKDSQIVATYPLQAFLQALPQLLAYVSDSFTLRTGDLLALALSTCFVPLQATTNWEATLGDERLLAVAIK